MLKKIFSSIFLLSSTYTSHVFISISMYKNNPYLSEFLDQVVNKNVELSIICPPKIAIKIIETPGVFFEAYYDSDNNTLLLNNPLYVKNHHKNTDIFIAFGRSRSYYCPIQINHNIGGKIYMITDLLKLYENDVTFYISLLSSTEWLKRLINE